MISNKLRVNWVVVIGCVLLLIMFTVTTFVSPDTIVYYSFFFTGKIGINEIVLGVYVKFVHIARFVGDLSFFFFLFCSYPFSFKTKNQLTYVIFPAVLLTLIGVTYTFLFERNQISVVMNGGNPELIRSIFHSKNAYGIFLFNGSVGITFIFFSDSRKKFKLMGLLLPIFLVVSFIINCKLAAVCILALLLLAYVYSIFRYFKTRPLISFILLGAAIVFSIAVTILFTVPQLRSIDFISKLYSKLVDSISNIDISSFIGRTEEWAMVNRMATGIYKWIGFSTPAGYQLVTSYTSINAATSTGVYDLHNAYVDFYAYHGIIGCTLLGLLYAYIGYLIYLLFKKDKRMSILISIIFFVSILFGMAETYRLFLSASANTFSLNIIILGTLLFELKDKSDIHIPRIYFPNFLNRKNGGYFNE